MNGAGCKDGINSYKCTCLPGYSGDECKTGIAILSPLGAVSEDILTL